MPPDTEPFFKRILLIENREDVARDLTKQLENMGCRVRLCKPETPDSTYASPEEKPDLALMCLPPEKMVECLRTTGGWRKKTGLPVLHLLWPASPDYSNPSPFEYRIYPIRAHDEESLEFELRRAYYHFIRSEKMRKFEFIANSTRDFMALINRNYVYEAVNQAYRDVLPPGRKAVEGRSLTEMWGRNVFLELIKPKLDECFKGKRLRHEQWFEFHERGLGYYEVTYNPYRESGGRVSHVVVVSHEITRRRLMEEQIRTALKEKELLIREVHHRVKNNMLVVGSLLRLQTQKVQSGSAREALEESRRRVEAMSLIHEQIYQSSSLADVNLAEYVERLAETLFKSFSEQSGKVRLNLNMRSVSVDVDHAVPCGLILNELLTNVFKHAFPEGAEGLVTVECGPGPEGAVILSVSDNGRGLPEDADWEGSSSLGLSLVDSLATRQLKGTLEVIRENGTTFTLSFRPQR